MGPYDTTGMGKEEYLDSLDTILRDEYKFPDSDVSKIVTILDEEIKAGRSNRTAAEKLSEIVPKKQAKAVRETMGKLPPIANIGKPPEENPLFIEAQKAFDKGDFGEVITLINQLAEKGHFSGTIEALRLRAEARLRLKAIHLSDLPPKEKKQNFAAEIESVDSAIQELEFALEGERGMTELEAELEAELDSLEDELEASLEDELEAELEDSSKQQNVFRLMVRKIPNPEFFFKIYKGKPHDADVAVLRPITMKRHGIEFGDTLKLAIYKSKQSKSGGTPLSQLKAKSFKVVGKKYLDEMKKVRDTAVDQTLGRESIYLLPSRLRQDGFVEGKFVNVKLVKGGMRAQSPWKNRGKLDRLFSKEMPPSGNPSLDAIFKKISSYRSYSNGGYKLKLALKEANTALQHYPMHRERILAQRSILYHKMENYTKALKDYNELLSIDPNCPAYMVNRGLLYRNIGEYHLALDDLNRALELFKKKGEMRCASQVEHELFTLLVNEGAHCSTCSELLDPSKLTKLKAGEKAEVICKKCGAKNWIEMFN
ncbi:MAG: tetratricopeptide repeat protein [archaeon]